MLLVDAQSVQTVLGMPSGVSKAVADKLEVAASTATSLLEAYLCTEFGRETRTQVFQIDSCIKPISREGAWLRLDSGQVDESTSPVVIKRAPTIEYLATHGEVIPPERYRVDAKRGLVLLLPFHPEDLHGYRRLYHWHDARDYHHGSDDYFVEMQYTAGYGTSGESFKNVPMWLKTAATRVAVAAYKDSSMCCDDDDESSPASTVQIVEGIVGKLIEKHIRWYPHAVSPLY